jgi:hypothetical protein
VTRYLHSWTPSGMVISVPFPDRLVTYGTYCAPTSFIPFDDPEEVAERERAEGAGRALDVLRTARPGGYSAAWSCPSCLLAAPRDLLPLGFPLEPLSGA